MNTLTIQIGNSDDRLTQKQWSEFVEAVHNAINKHHMQIHFAGGSHSCSPWQNACWVVENNENENALSADLIAIRAKYMQDSLTFTPGHTLFI